MADAIPPNLLNGLRAIAKASHINHMVELKGSIGSSNSLVRHASSRILNEGSPEAARATDKVLRLPKAQAAK